MYVSLLWVGTNSSELKVAVAAAAGGVVVSPPPSLKQLRVRESAIPRPHVDDDGDDDDDDDDDDEGDHDDDHEDDGDCSLRIPAYS